MTLSPIFIPYQLAVSKHHEEVESSGVSIKRRLDAWKIMKGRNY